MNAIVLTFDRLPEAFLGCCGNGWIDTPNFDRLAAQSAVFNQHFAENLDSSSSRHAWFRGRYECRRGPAASDGRSPVNALVDRGITVRLLIETVAGDELTEIPDFPRACTETVTGSDGLDVPMEETPFLRLVARAQRDLRLFQTSRREPWLLWIKSQGVPAPWIAPRAFAAKFLDVSDEAEGDDNEPPDVDSGDSLVEMSPEEFDDLLGSSASLPEGRKQRDSLGEVERNLIRKVFGGYVALLDAGLGQLWEPIVQARAASPTLLIVTAAEGATVRDCSTLRDECGRLAEETIHTPLFVRPAEMSGGRRRQALVQPVDLMPTLFDWFGLDCSDIELDGNSLLPSVRGTAANSDRRAFCSDGRGFFGVRTSDYYLVAARSEQEVGARRCRLFAKPEDIWECNDLAGQSPDMVEQLSGELEQFVSEGAT